MQKFRVLKRVYDSHHKEPNPLRVKLVSQCLLRHFAVVVAFIGSYQDGVARLCWLEQVVSVKKRIPHHSFCRSGYGRKLVYGRQDFLSGMPELYCLEHLACKDNQCELSVFGRSIYYFAAQALQT